MSKSSKKIRLYTSQSEIVLDTIREKGIYHVKKEFIIKKYENVANVFLEPYNWFIRNAVNIVPKPEGAEYPIWLFTDLKYVENHEDSQVLEIEVEIENVILFDPFKWNRILNLAYIPKDEKDWIEYNESLEKQGIKNEASIYMTNFYPHLKQKVKKSWDSLFEDNIDLSKPNQAALWELRREWIVSDNI
ncbi:hypothetical protein CIW83_11545 [Tissierella sp. P1]|uniref:DUF3841 domain-containing protein n=1 Tax=Tissierella sp. P1 TaxID=1280483 RepID=UPI000B9FC05D|nr:DUF3841 domain-containing protein [Tissierella sp. P1]OZV12060.1 hypothetical protein CIW83_11545 [Tissierella sp. P1]